MNGTTTAPRPVVFLNPNVLEKGVLIGGGPAQAFTRYQPESVSMRDEPAEALVELLRRTGAQLVCTAAIIGGYDARDFMLNRGVRGEAFAPEWFASATPAERHQDAQAWRARHGGPRAIVIDRPSTAPRASGTVTVELPEGRVLTTAVIAQAAEMLAAPAAA